ncbi:glycosyltransferase [Kineococcus arenarius]|uniref:glycosyltransferase n=1 Tax=unclassified Kineococcus TaxID=2621656 RepID=UPI003D7C5090
MHQRSEGPAGPVFLDPSGRRWRAVRRSAAVTAALAALAVVVAAPHLHELPQELARVEHRTEVTSAQTGLDAPIVGSGPLVRVLEVASDDGRTVGLDPFTGAVLTELAPEEVRAAGSSRYVIEKYGYSATAERTISLTFDDGPDATYTPELLDLLSRNDVPATFFVTGESIARHPEIIRREAREGHAIANHSLTHVDITSSPDWRARLELVTTDRILRAATHQSIGYFRLPYEGDDLESTQQTIDGLLRAQEYGYVVTSHDVDTLDWMHTQEGSTIPLPDLSSGENITMLLHDAGGTSRQQTLDYVAELIPYAKAHGYTFHTMPQVQPWLQERVRTVEPTFWDELTFELARIAFGWSENLVRVLFGFAVASVFLLGTFNTALALVRRRRRRGQLARWASCPPVPVKVTVLLAAYDEGAVIARTLRSLLASTHPVHEFLVIDDGSSDDTAEQVRLVALDDPRVRVVRQPNTGKSGALNHGMRIARGDVVVTLDADTIVLPHTVGNLVRHFQHDHDGTLGAVAGVVRVGNSDRNVITRWQALEYVTQIGVERAAADFLGAISIVPGACAAWRRRAVLAAGGFSESTLAEDCDLCLSLHRSGWRITQDDEAPAYTEAPETTDALLQQRVRWTFGTMQAIWRHRGLLFHRSHRWLGWFVLPWYAASVLLPLLFLPLLTVMLVCALQIGGAPMILEYFAAFTAVNLVVVGVGVRLMGEPLRILLFVPVYRLIYEPLRAYLLYTCALTALRGARLGWNKLARTGVLDLRHTAALAPVAAQHEAARSADVPA